MRSMLVGGVINLPLIIYGCTLTHFICDICTFSFDIIFCFVIHTSNCMFFILYHIFGQFPFFRRNIFTFYHAVTHVHLFALSQRAEVNVESSNYSLIYAMDLPNCTSFLSLLPVNFVIFINHSYVKLLIQ